MYTIVRIEHPSDNKGLFTSKSDPVTTKLTKLSCKKDVLNKHNSMDTPYGDVCLFDKYDSDIHLCGYRSVEEMFKWLNYDQLNEIVEAGFKVYKITLKYVIIGIDQVIFDPKHIITKEDCSDMFVNNN